MMVQEGSTYSKTVRGDDKGAKTVVLGQLTLGKLMLLTLISLVLGAIFPLSLFAPLPLALGFLLFGVKATFIAAGAAIAGAFILSTLSASLAFVSSYGLILAFMTVIGFAIATIITRNESPVSGLLLRVGIVSALFVGAIFYADNFSSTSLKSYVENIMVMQSEAMKKAEGFDEVLKAGGENARMVEIFVNSPKKIADDAYKYVYSMVFIGSFLLLWFPLYMLMKFSDVWSQVYQYEYKLKELREFKTPEAFTYVFIAGLALFLGGDLLSPALTALGVNLIYAMGVVYFFQGIGLYIDFLNYSNIRGFFRLFLIILTVLVAYNMVAIFGLVDNWVNFRKYLKKEEN